MTPCRRTALSRCAVLALALSACGETTAPRPTLGITVSVAELRGPTVSANGDGQPTVTCEIDLRAAAAGKGTATWLDATFRIYIGKNRSTPIDSAMVSAEEIAQVWGAPEIAAGERQESRWIATVGIPFSATMEFRYRPSSGSRVHSATVSFSCSPEIPPNAAPPQISTLTVTPPSGELPAGAPLTVSYAATAQTGLWLTGLRISGPCEVQQSFVEELRTTVARTVSVPLPAGCRLGVPITVTVDAMDAAAQQTSRSLATQLVLADKEPPKIEPLFFPPNGGSATRTLSGDYFAGDSIQLIFNAHDNHALAHLVWEVLPYGARDSLVVAGPGAGPWIWVRLRPEWSGPIQLRLYARDAVGLVSAAVITEPDSVYVRPTVARPTRTGTVTGETRDIAVDTRRGLIYLAQGNDRRLAVFSTATMELSTTLPLPAVPTDLDLTAGGDSLLLVLYGRPELGVVDLRQSPLALSTLPITGLDATVGQAPVGVRVGSNGRAYVTLGGSTASARTMLEVNLTTGATRPLPGAGVGGITGVGMIERSHDRSVLVLTTVEGWCMQRYHVAADAFSSCVKAVPSDWRPSVDGTGARIAVGLDVYDASLQLLPKTGRPLTLGIPYTALSVDGESLFVVLWNHGIVRLRASDSRILDRTPNTIKPNRIRVSPDGTTLITVESNYGAATKISVMDLRVAGSG